MISCGFLCPKCGHYCAEVLVMSEVEMELRCIKCEYFWWLTREEEGG